MKLALFLLMFACSQAFAARLIPPNDLTYIGAFRVPQGDVTSGLWFGYTIGYVQFNPAGDDGDGSLIMTGGTSGSINWYQPIELRIPTPVNSQTINSLPTATAIGWSTNYYGSYASCGGIDSLCVVDFEIVDAIGEQTQTYSYWTRYVEYMPDNNALAMGRSATLASPNAQGIWGINTGSNVNTASYAKFLLRAPQSWANTYTSGRSLIVGQNKINNGGSWGPSLYATAPWASAATPSTGTYFPATNLSFYDGFNQSDPARQAVKWYSHGDQYKDAVWVTVGSKSAVIFSGTQAWRSAEDRVPGSVMDPSRDYSEQYPWEKYRCGQLTDAADCDYSCNASGYDGHPYIPMLAFFDPADYARVAQGQLAAHKVHPYAFMQLTNFTQYGVADCNFDIIGGIAYDPESQRIYVAETYADGVYPIVHVFELSDTAASAIDNTPPPQPANLAKDGSTISWDSVSDGQSGSNVAYIVYKNCGRFGRANCTALGNFYPFIITRSTSFNDTEATGATIANYQVRAVDLLLNESSGVNPPRSPTSVGGN